MFLKTWPIQTNEGQQQKTNKLIRGNKKKIDEHKRSQKKNKVTKMKKTNKNHVSLK